MSPLIASTAVGRRVLVLRESTWPTYGCEEHGGLGWEAIVKSVVRGNAKVHFLYATDSQGRPYADENLQFEVLRPL